MSDWFHPYRYIEPELRQGTLFATLNELAADIDRWRRSLGANRVRCETTAEAWDNGLEPDRWSDAPDAANEERVAIVRVTASNSQTGEELGVRTCLTAGEEQGELFDAIRAAAQIHRKAA